LHLYWKAGPVTDKTLLLRRRELLQLRLRRQDEARRVRVLAQALYRCGVRSLSRLPASRSSALLHAQASWPGRDERFYWPEIAGSRTVVFDDDAGRDRAFAEAVHACFAPSMRLAIVFHTAESSLLIGVADVLAHAGAILDACSETVWVVRAGGGASLVEVSRVDQQVCWLDAGR
jgi:hypothetical protein